MPFHRLTALSLSAAALLCGAGPAATVRAQDTGRSGPQTIIIKIEGRVVSPDGKPVENAIVRLYDEGGFREAGRTTSNTSGRYEFYIAVGSYVVEVDPIQNPNLARQRQEVLASAGVFSSTAQNVRADFFLKPAAPVASRPPELVFAQAVPAEAKAEYDRALKVWGGNREEGLGALRRAVELFPTYYDALELLGTAYVKDNHIEPALVVLQKAVEVNPKGERSYYGLGVANYKLGRFDDAVANFKKADALIPNNANTVLYMGLAHARGGRMPEAEAALKKAHDLGANGVPELHYALTQIYEKTSRFKEAANQLKTLLKEIPSLPNKDQIKQLIARYEKK